MSNITIIQHYTDDIAECFDLVRANNAAYAYKHGYNYIAVKVQKCEGHDSTWDKVFILDKHISVPNIDPNSWFHFLDADAIYINDNIKLESIINAYSTPVIISQNGPNGGEHLNMGSILLKADARTQEMLDYAINFFHSNPAYKKGIWHEQTAINLFYSNHPEGKNTITSVPFNIINSHWKWTGDYSMFIYHAMSSITHDKYSDMSRNNLLKNITETLSSMRDK